MNRMNNEMVALCDQLPIVSIQRNDDGKTTIVPMGMYDLNDGVWCMPADTKAIPVSDWDGSLTDCEPDIKQMSREDIAATVDMLGVQKLDTVSVFTPDGFYALPYCPVDALPI